MKMIAALLICSQLRPLLSRLLRDSGYVWQVNNGISAVMVALSATIALSLIPYSRLREKCLVAVVAGIAWAEVATQLAWYSVDVPDSLYYAICLSQAASGLFLALLYWLRSYKAENDPLESGFLYCLRRRPATVRDLIIAMSGAFGAGGGYALYADGIMYSFRKGAVHRTHVGDRVPENYHITRGRKLSAQTMDRLSQVVGVKWTFRRNCLTTLRAIWRDQNV